MEVISTQPSHQWLSQQVLPVVQCSPVSCIMLPCATTAIAWPDRLADEGSISCCASIYADAASSAALRNVNGVHQPTWQCTLCTHLPADLCLQRGVQLAVHVIELQQPEAACYAISCKQTRCLHCICLEI
jgi:hypothetical protein